MKAERSPFTPGQPVPVEYFAGRMQEINQLIHSIRQSTSGRGEHVFITGEKGIGKSSLAGFAKYLAENDNQLIPADLKLVAPYCLLGGAINLIDVCKCIVSKLIEELKQPSILGHIKNALRDYIDEIEPTLLGVGLKITFNKDDKVLNTLPTNFITLLRVLAELAKRNERKGIMIILDDINGIAKVSGVANFMKSTIDEIAIKPLPLPVSVILVGIPERMDDLSNEQSSIRRIFRVIELNRMREEESREFLEKAFQRVNLQYKKSAINRMVHFSGGFPALLHEIGDATVLIDSDGSIDEKDVAEGLPMAAVNVGRKYLDPKVYREIRSKTYRSILGKVTKLLPQRDLTPEERTIKRKETLLKAGLINSEKKNLENFFRKMVSLGVLRKVGTGEYEFANELFRYYLTIWLPETSDKI